MNRQKFLVALTVIGMTALFPLWSQTDDPSTLTLDQCLSIAIQKNPLIQSAYKDYDASLARVQQAKAFPQPSINWDSDLQPKLFDFKGTNEWYFGLSQTLEFPGKRYVRGKIARKRADELMQEIELLKLDIRFQVKEAFYALLLAQEKHNYAEQNLKLSQEFLQNTQLKFETGDVARVEVLRAQVEVSKAANALRVASNEVRLAKARLNYLMAREKYSPLQIKGELKKEPISLDREDLKQRAFSSRPEMKRIHLSQERQKLQKSQAYMSYLPDFDMGVNKHKIHGEGEWWDVTLSFPIPLFFWQPAKGQIAEAEAALNSLNNRAQHLKNSIALEVEEAYMNAESTKNQIELFEEDILSQSREVYEMFLYSYQQGEIGGIELIEARRTLIQSRKSYADALYNYDVALAALEKSIGQKIEGERQ